MELGISLLPDLLGSGEVVYFVREEQSALCWIQNDYFFLPCDGSMRRFFSNHLCEKLLGLLEGILTKSKSPT